MKILFKYYLLFLTILFLSCEQNNTVASIDCAGVVGGLFEIDECGDCSDPYSSDWNGSCTDCSGILNGVANYDPCGHCICDPNDYPQGPPAGSLCKYPLDINGDGIASYNDNESFYIGADIYGQPIAGSFDDIPFYTIPCIRDCNEQFGGNAYLDGCNICVLDGEYPSVDTDDDGECDGIDYDGDGLCDEINNGNCDCPISSCDLCIDYNVDACGICNGNNVDADNDGLCDGSDADGDGQCDRDINSSCDGEDTCLWDDFVPYDNNCGDCDGIVDECQICNGVGIDADNDGLCDNLDLDDDGNIDDTCLAGIGDNGSGTIDDCGVCGGNGINPGACNCDGDIEDCIGICGGNALIDDCGLCYNYNIAIDGNPTFILPQVDYDNDGICDGTDADGDGQCDEDNGSCDGADDCVDLDNDGVCGSLDNCQNDPYNDADSDGICGDVDQCEGFDDNIDDDGDGIANGCDVCIGHNDLIDNDNDSIPNGCDQCEGFDDSLDEDGDGIANGCDLCNGENSSTDTDGDGICNNLDICEGFDDTLDDDNDGFPNDCDQCEGFDDSLDEDGDGIINGCDICNGDNSTNDTDNDGTCNDLDDDDDNDNISDIDDSCPLDENNDEDGDGECGDIDLCNGDNSTTDTDNDGICNDLDNDDDDDGITDENDCSPEDNSISILDCESVCGGPATFDCSNTCNGPATIDQCGICSGYSTTLDNIPTTIYPSVDTDNDGLCDGTDADNDGNCDQDQNGNCDGEDTCIGNNFDECGVCDGNGVDVDTDGICDDVDDCIGNNYDVCGICNGNGEDIDNDGLCDNYDVNGDGLIDDSCIDTDDDEICDHNDPCLDTDTDGICDDVDDCVGSFDQCGDCNGDGTSCLVNDGCDLDPDTIYIHENSEIWYNLSFDINDFSLSLTNNSIIQVSGGAFESNGLQDNITAGVLFIYSGTIPAGCGTLFNLTVSDDSEDIAIDEFSFNNGNNTATYCDSCIYEFQDPCDAYNTLSTNSISLLYDGTVIYNIDFDLNQFEWTVDNATSITSLNGGSSEDAGFDFQTVGNILYAFANGTTISAGCGELTQMALDEYNNISLSNIIFKDVADNIINITYIEANDCQDTVDECGVCGGNGIPDGDCDCYGNVLDECGVCDGPGIAEGTCDCDGNIDADGDGVCDTTDFDASTMPTNSVTIDDIGNVYYNVDFVIGGFQWVVDGATVSGGTGGDAQDAGFVVQGGGSTILGFSFTGSCVQNGFGKLSTMTIASGTPTSLSDIVFSDCDGIAQTVTYYPIP